MDRIITGWVINAVKSRISRKDFLVIQQESKEATSPALIEFNFVLPDKSITFESLLPFSFYPQTVVYYICVWRIPMENEKCGILVKKDVCGN